LSQDDALAYQKVLSLHRAPDTAEQEITFRLKDKAVWISQFSYPEYDADGHLQSVYCYLLNATAQKAVEQQLERARLEMYVRLDSVAIGTWSYDPQTDIRRVSPRMAEMLGFEPEELRIAQRDWVELIHPDDRAYVSAATREELQNRQRHPNEKPRLRSVEYRIRNRDGVYLWVQSGGAFIESTERPGSMCCLDRISTLPHANRQKAH
jgi:PAS domain S-box-containing protein